MNFELEKNIKEWIKGIKANKAFDDGDSKEYEEHLRDEIKSLVESGFDEQVAFNKAVENFGEPKKVADEIGNIVKNKTPIKRNSFLLELSILNLLPSYLKLSVRNIFRNKFYTIINVFSVSLGIIVSVLVLQYFLYETNQDTFNSDYESIYRINVERLNDNGERAFATAINFPALSGILRNESESVEAVAQLMDNSTIVRNGETVFQESGLFYTQGATVFDIFSFEIETGNTEDLNIPGTVFLSRELAAKYFGDDNPVGQTLEIIDVVGEWTDFEVRGVYNTVPEISHIQPTALFNDSDVMQKIVDSGTFGSIPYDDIVWRLRNNYTYAKLKPGNNVELLKEELNAIKIRYRAPFDERQGINTVFTAQPISEIHTTPEILNEPKAIANLQSLYFILGIGIAALFIGWINYVNLATASSLKRAKEVGIRKVMGSSKAQLIIQFILESLLINLIAIIISVGFLASTNQRFEDLIGLNVFDYVQNFSAQWTLYIFVICLGVLASGFYPSLILSRFKPISTLKGVFQNSKSGIILRKGLVLFQFSLSLFLIISIYVVFNQVEYIKSLDKGLNIENTYVVNAPSLIDGNSLVRFEAFKQDLETIAGLSNITNSSIVPGTSNVSSIQAEKLFKEEGEERVRVNFARIDYEYLNHYGIELIAGRNFEEDRGTDHSTVIVNESALNMLGFNSANDALNDRIISSLGDTVEIIGITKNYAQQSLQEDYIPLILRLPVDIGFAGGMGTTSIKLNSQNTDNLVNQVEEVFNSHFPGDIFNGYFLEDQYNQAYASEDRFRTIFSYFTLISVFITILGLIGLSSFMIGQRRKEIGIRKVLGSSTHQIINLILKDYFKLIGYSCLIGIPIAVLWFNDWLEQFPFKFTPTVLTILVPVFLLLIVTVIAVSNQSIRAAVVKPVRSLRTE